MVLTTLLATINIIQLKYVPAETLEKLRESVTDAIGYAELKLIGHTRESFVVIDIVSIEVAG